MHTASTRGQTGGGLGITTARVIIYSLYLCLPLLLLVGWWMVSRDLTDRARCSTVLVAKHQPPVTIPFTTPLLLLLLHVIVVVVGIIIITVVVRSFVQQWQRQTSSKSSSSGSSGSLEWLAALNEAYEEQFGRDFVQQHVY